MIGRLLFIQIVRHDFYRALARGQQGDFRETVQNRGEIFMSDRNGALYPLAINKKTTSVYVKISELGNKEEATDKLSQILSLGQKDILAKIDRSVSSRETIKERLSNKEIADLRKERLIGVCLDEKVARYYPQGELASQVIGFIGGEGNGQYGLEGYYNDVLEGLKSVSPNGLPVENSGHGPDLLLTLDYNIQAKAQRLLEEKQKTLGYEEGIILVLEPKTGKIKALASVPSFDPNEYGKENKLEIFQNGAIQQIFEPGSIFKAITMAAALEEGKVTPETTYIDTGFLRVGGSTIYNYDLRTYGQRTMTEVLEKSINTGAVFAQRSLGNQLFADYIEKFGFYELTGIDLQGEVFSNNLEFKNGYEINFVTASFGQGVEMTLIQLARAYSAIANGGRLAKPYIVDSFKHADGQAIQVSPQLESKPVISPQTASKITAMLASVVKNGFSKAAQVPGYYLAGKTGTAQVSWSALGIKKSGYSDKTIQTFIGFGPSFNPRFLILVKLNDPATGTAEYSAVPIFQELAKYIIDYEQIPPDYE